MKVERELLPWIWAYREQLTLLDKHDDFYFRCAKIRWSVEVFIEFLKDYGLGRGPAGAGLNDNSQRVLYAISDLLNRRLKDQSDMIQLWEDSIDAVRSVIDYSCPSATAKFLSFHFPKHMTMYDTYSASALRMLYGAEGTSDPVQKRTWFLKTFETFLTDNEHLINESEKYTDRKYPYKRRVADKVLWLKGYYDGKVVLDRFFNSLKTSPIQQH